MLSICSGGHVVHSEGRLIPHEFPITDLQQIIVSSGNGVIACTVSNGTAMFYSTTGALLAGGVTQVAAGSTAALIVNTNNFDSFQNRDVYCGDIETQHFYLYLTSSNRGKSFYLNRHIQHSINVCT